jgi:HAD superfamily hydrolase (TIGR01662 family)
MIRGRGVLFDLGSTLLYSEHDHNWGVILPRMRANLLAHLQSAGYALEAQAFLNLLSAKYTEYDQQRQNDWVECTTEWILQSTLAELGLPPASPEILSQALAAYYAYSESLWHPMADVHAVLQQLQAAGLRLAIVSNAADNGNVQRLIDRANLRGYFDPILVSAAVGIRKPNPRIFELVLQAWGFAPGECVMVGDTLGADILGAQMAGLHNVWLTAHADHAANRAHRGNILPEVEIESLADLPKIIGQFNPSSFREVVSLSPEA